MNGGLDLAVEAVFGARAIWHAEIEAAPAKVLAAHWPDVPNLGDITTIDWATVERPDILCGGYPCQPFSSAGRREGVGDARHLWPYVAEAISELQPRACVFENVQGHLTLGFDEVLRDLAILGYETRWTLLRASTIGAPHHRARLFMLATKGDTHGSLRSRIDRRGGIRRDSGVGRDVPRAAQSGDDRQGTPGAASDALTLRGEPESGSGGEGTAPGVPRMGSDGCTCGGAAEGDQAGAAGEGARSRCGSGLSADGRRGSTAAERESDLDAADAGAGGVVSGSNPGSESSGAGPGPAGPAAVGGLPRRAVVGASGQSVRSCPVHGSLAEVGADESGQDLPDADADGQFIVAEPADADCNRCGEGPRQSGAGEPEEPTTVGGVPALFPTPAAGNFNDGESVDGWLERRERVKETANNGNGMGMPLTIAVQMLPTPTASDRKGGSRTVPDGQGGRRPITIDDTTKARGDGGASTLSDAVSVLPTPGANLGEHRRDNGQNPDKRRAAGRQVSLADVTCHLPTPRTTDGNGAGHHGDGGPDLRTAAIDDDLWGKYGPAIRRWESIVGPAPDPTEPNSNGKPRLSARFVEWLMGLPAGWVTGHGLSRGDELKILGNGVVPQQAVAALWDLLAMDRQVAA